MHGDNVARIHNIGIPTLMGTNPHAQQRNPLTDIYKLVDVNCL